MGTEDTLRPGWLEGSTVDAKENAMKTWPGWMKKIAGVGVDVYQINSQICVYVCDVDGDIKLIVKPQDGSVQEFLLAPCDVNGLSKVFDTINKASICLVNRRVEGKFQIR